MRVLSRILKILLLLAYLGLVAWLCFGDIKPDPDIPRSFFGIPTDKIAHFLMFLPFPVLGTLALDFRSWWRTLALTTLLANVLAFSFEFLQSRITATRVTDPADLCANLLGITVGLLLAIVIGLALRKR